MMHFSGSSNKKHKVDLVALVTLKTVGGKIMQNNLHVFYSSEGGGWPVHKTKMYVQVPQRGSAFI